MSKKHSLAEWLALSHVDDDTLKEFMSYGRARELLDLLKKTIQSAGEKALLSTIARVLEYEFGDLAHTYLSIIGMLENRLVATDASYQRMLPKPRKTERNPAIHRLKIEEGLTSWVKIRERLKTMDLNWVTIKKTGKLVGLKALENGYKVWLASQQTSLPG